ncbi:NPCBM/NEW2 domain-containing protein [Lentisphaerota bacterium WC36G]|nr:NPCBM/NEW2 domain-containing protein [Lentisphaerae bacterium WC36]
MKKCNYLKMKKFLSLSFAASLMLSLSNSLSASDGQFSVLSYNIGALPFPAWLGSSAGNPDGRVQYIGERINTFDIVGVQEQFAFKDKFRDGTRFPFFSINDHLYGGGSGVDLLSKYPISPSIRVEYDDHPFYVAKGFQKNTVTIYPGVYVDVYNTHTGDDMDTIDLQLIQLGNYIQANTPSNRAVIVVGDFNAKPSHWGDIKTPVMIPNNLKDAWTEFGVNESMWDSPVDRILYRSGADVEISLVQYETIDNTPLANDWYPNHFTKDGDQLSDHPAVLSIFNFTVADNKRLQSGDTQYLSEMKVNYGYNNGFDHGPIGINQAIGGGDEYDGDPLKLNSKTYSKGLGVHAFSRIIVNTNKKYSRFISDIGVDEESGSNGKVRFKVYINGSATVPGTLIYDSGAMDPWSNTQTIDVDVSNADTVKLIADTEGDEHWDHADWANARFILK